jgi:biopolymer transport protein ExbD
MQAGSDKDAVKSDINVTPLVDVVLVLLIIFMVITPMLQKGHNVLLPMTENPDKKPDNQNQLIISVAEDKGIYIDTERVSKNDFMVKMKELYQRSPGKEIMLKGDTRVLYKDVKDVMLMLQEAGFDRVALVTEKMRKKGEA